MASLAEHHHQLRKDVAASVTAESRKNIIDIVYATFAVSACAAQGTKVEWWVFEFVLP